ncbi:MAG: nuclear transport factor 2 family protein [Pseudomonadota bacterium]
MIPAGFERDWQAAWNAHDLERILGHYAENVVFRSEKAVATIGQGTVAGKAALRAYWSAALARQPDLAFSVEEVFRGHEMLVIVYSNHAGRRAAETLRFNAEGEVVEASACHDAGDFT